MTSEEFRAHAQAMIDLAAVVDEARDLLRARSDASALADLDRRLATVINAARSSYGIAMLAGARAAAHRAQLEEQGALWTSPDKTPISN